MHPFKTILNKNAFTLTELLMVLVAIGVIASILVPKVVMAGQNNSRRAQLQVVLQSLEGHFYDENLSGNQFLGGADRWANLQNQLQVSQLCAFGQSACLPPGVTNVATFAGGALRLQNGMVVYGLLSEPTSTTDDFYVDVNGNEGPNLGGLGGANIANDCNDRFHFNINHVTGEVTPIECTIAFMRG